jgi:putative metallohydrolase (TIGR04338 family)
VSPGQSAKRDSQRAKVYAAEEFVRTLFDRAAEHGSRAVDFFGGQLTLPPEGRFGSVSAAQRYVDQVLALPTVRRRWPSTAPLRVRPRRAATAAHYEFRDGAGIIAVPDRDTADWALRELVVFFGHFTAVYAQTRPYTLDLSVERGSPDSYL